MKRRYRKSPRNPDGGLAAVNLHGVGLRFGLRIFQQFPIPSDWGEVPHGVSFAGNGLAGEGHRPRLHRRSHQPAAGIHDPRSSLTAGSRRWTERPPPTDGKAAFAAAPQYPQFPRRSAQGSLQRRRRRIYHRSSSTASPWLLCGFSTDRRRSWSKSVATTNACTPTAPQGAVFTPVQEFHPNGCRTRPGAVSGQHRPRWQNPATRHPRQPPSAPPATQRQESRNAPA